MASIITSLQPKSPIHGMVNTAGDATHCPEVQFLNPSGSDKHAIVYEIRVGGTRPTTTNRVRVKRTTSPFTPGGTTTTALLEHRDETDATAISCTLKGYTAAKAAADLYPAEADSFWFDHITSDGTNPYAEVPLLVPLSFPIVVKEGSALEFGDPNNGTGQFLRVYVVFDEISNL
jgi:hypothetical protein